MTQKKRYYTAILNIRPMPKELKKKFKLWCLKKGLTMREAVISLILHALDDDTDLTKGKE